jgi:hypothetical protein
MDGPPPGSAPGYHAAHHCTPRKTANVRIGIHAYSVSPPPLNDTGSTESAAVSLPKWAANLVFIAVMPPTALTAKTASTITAVILITNCTRSVHSTAHMPAATEYAIVMTKQIPTAMTSPEIVMPPTCTSRRPRDIVRILIIARVTHPRMIRLIGMARYNARNTRSAAAGLPL